MMALFLLTSYEQEKYTYPMRVGYSLFKEFLKAGGK